MYYFISISKEFHIKILYSIFLFPLFLFANFENEFKELETKKQKIINNYEIRVELAEIENKKVRFNLLNKTLNCIKNSRSSGEIDSCRAKERAILMDYISRDFDNSKEFIIEKNRLLIYYKSKFLKTKLNRKKQAINETLKCIKTSKKLSDINTCKHNESLHLEKIYLSFEDNPKLKKLINKVDLIDRYKIRIEMAKLDNDISKVEIFSKTLKCFESSRTKRDVYFCKNNEKNRILKYLN